MGLDVVAYSRLRKWREEDGPSAQIILENAPCYRDRLDTYEEGAYVSIGEKFGEASTGYGSWAKWCDVVSLLILGAPASEVRLRPSDFVGRSFVEIFDFGVEGAIGPRTCAKLFADFEKHHEEVCRLLKALDESSLAQGDNILDGFHKNIRLAQIRGELAPSLIETLMERSGEIVWRCDGEALYCQLEESFRRTGAEGVVVFG